ncbi:hypothetical protein NQ318_001653 [Aromia moschata]|uniref:Uncharacterized protein n=1 Tax=Aromia moschata TaxID=1265417 RepID=A0AAV8XZU0_9CUCU|nr:hypothetical protein NQ318_001653 [Aromia moschata]
MRELHTQNPEKFHFLIFPQILLQMDVFTLQTVVFKQIDGTHELRLQPVRKNICSDEETFVCRYARRKINTAVAVDRIELSYLRFQL